MILDPKQCNDSYPDDRIIGGDDRSKSSSGTLDPFALDEMIDLQIYSSSSTCMDTAMPAGVQLIRTVFSMYIDVVCMFASLLALVC